MAQSFIALIMESIADRIVAWYMARRAIDPVMSHLSNGLCITYEVDCGEVRYAKDKHRIILD